MGKYRLPADFKAALKAAAVRASKESGASADDVMRTYYFNRLAARVFTSDPDGWLIKGGQALLVRYSNAARLSRDIDLQSARPERSSEEAVAALVAAAGHDLDDMLRFTPTKFVAHADGERGGAQYFGVYIGNGLAATIKVDVVIGRRLTGQPERRQLRSAVSMEWPDDWPKVLLYPVVDHVADKICAMYEWHNQAPSSRYRDLADLLLISQQEVIDGPLARQVLRSEAVRRLGLGNDLRLPDEFEVPDRSWNDRNYGAAAALVSGLVGCRNLRAASVVARAFVTPLLGEIPLGQWDPQEARWQ